MFESYEFLDNYLPQYFEKVVQRAHYSSKGQKPIQTDLKTLSQLIKYSHNLYKALNLHDHFLWFLSQQFSFLNQTKQSISSMNSQVNHTRKNKVMEILEKKLDKITLSCIELYMKILQIQIIIDEKSLSKQEISKYGSILVRQCNQIRLQYELNRFQMQSEKNFDDYMTQLFKFVLKEEISTDMQLIIKEILSNQLCNFSEETISQIESSFKRIPSESTKTNQQSGSQNDIIKMMRKTNIKKKKRIQRINSPGKKRTDRINKQNQNSVSPDKLNGQKQRQPLSPASKEPFERFRKEKLITKKRTIYYQRKNIYMPRVKDFLQKMNSFASQQTIASFEKQKKTDVKIFKFQNTQSTFDDNESVLVRSTPKPKKKFSVKMICQKLDF